MCIWMGKTTNIIISYHYQIFLRSTLVIHLQRKQETARQSGDHIL